MEYSTPSEYAPMLDAMETGINSPVSAFRPIVNEMPNTSEERTLSPPQCSASGTSHGAIDNRIEQAMDLVKSHLMNAVRSEVEELKEKIIRLEDTINNLQSENEFMKKHVTSDVLRQISSTPAPLLAVQQQTQPIASTTGYANVVVNPTAQQAITSSVPAVTNNAVPISNINTNLGTQQATTLPNAANTNSVVNPGVANIITPSQTAPTYMPQATGTQVAPANSQLPPANPPQ
jgi:hypothetical protein